MLCVVASSAAAILDTDHGVLLCTGDRVHRHDRKLLGIIGCFATLENAGLLGLLGKLGSLVALAAFTFSIRPIGFVF